MASFAPAAYANDSEAAIPVGGLTLIESDMISMDSEDLYISAEQVRVAYQFTNHSAEDISTLIAFPLPGYGPEDYLSGEFRRVDISSVDFQTTIDGSPTPLSMTLVAMLDGKSVNNIIEAAGLPIDWIKDEAIADRIGALPEQTRNILVTNGLIQQTSYEGWRPLWSVVPNVTRQQVFPAGETVSVTHRYTPVVGGSIGGGVEYDVDAYRSRYCTDASFTRGFKRKQAAVREQAGDPTFPGYTETWLSYVLSSGANWKGPISDFRLVIDKGDPASLVSFCMDGVKKISPTQFEIRKTNFEPAKDLNILIVNWIKP